MFKKTTSLIVSFSLLLTQPIFAQGAAELNIGKYLSQMPALNTDRFRPPQLRYISYNLKSNDFKLLLDQGDTKLQNSPVPEFNQATQELFNYFLIGLSLSNDKFWVNLRPDAPEQIIDPELEKTDLGKVMLEADLQLKQDTAGLTSPQTPEGKEYWDKLYKKAGELFGTENITIPTVTRPWIVPGEVIIRENEDSAYIYKANLKVMLEEDYINSQPSAVSHQQYTFSDPRMKELNRYSTQLIKELILPRLTQEINTSKKYAQLRQVFFSLILSRWFKDKFKGKLGQYSSLIDSRNLDNLTSQDPWSKDYYFNEYKKSFQQGEYNLKEQITTPTGQAIKSYVSGGILPMLGAEDINSFKVPRASSSALRDKIITGAMVSFVISGLYWGVKIESINNSKREKLRQEEAFTGIVNNIHSQLWELDELNKSGKLPANDYIRLVEILKTPDRNNPEKAIRDAIGYLRVLTNNNRNGQAEEMGKIILKLEKTLKSLPSQGSSPLAPQEGASSAIKDIRDEVKKILIDLKNSIPAWEIKLESGWSIEVIPNDQNDEYGLLDWANSVRSSLYKRWFEIAYAKQSWWERFLERFSEKDFHSVLRTKYPAVDAAFGVARDRLNSIEEDIRKREKAQILMERKKKVEDFINVPENKKKIMAVPEFQKDFMRRTETRNNISVPKEDEDIPYLCYMIYTVLLLDDDRRGADEWRQAYPSEIGHSYITHSDGHFDNTPNNLDISYDGNDWPSGHYNGVDGLGDLGSSPLTQQEAENRFNQITADYQASIDSLIKKVGKEAANWSAKKLLTQSLELYRKFIADREQKYQASGRSLAMMGIIVVDMISDADVYIQDVTTQIKDKQDLNKEKAKAVFQDCKEAMEKLAQELKNLDQDISAALYPEEEQKVGSSPLTQEEASKQILPGGIDFRKINYLTRPMGSFQGLDLRLPLLSKAELEGIDINRELAAVEQMINAKIEVSTDRLKCLLAALSQKDAFTAKRETQLLPLLLRLCWLKEERGTETTPDFRAVLLIADTGLFVAQGKEKYSLN